MHWVSLFVDRHTAMYFDTYNIFRVECDHSILCEFYCTAFIEHMLAGKTLLDYTNFFSPNGYENNNKIIYKYFKYKDDERKHRSWI